MPQRTALLFGLAILLAALGLWLGLKPQQPQKPAVVAIAPLAPAPEPKPEPPKPAPVVAPAPPPLPTVNVASVPVHAPPADSPPPTAEGRPLDLRHAEATPTQQVVTTASPPTTSSTVMRGGTAPEDFSGTGRVTSATGLIVGGVPVELYGLEHPGAGNRCGGSSCEDAAMAALQARLSEGGRVSCHSPRHNMGVVAFAVCLDGSGVDLGGMLVGDGLALAKRQQSKDYVGAERVAHDLHHGLWQSR